MYKRDGIGRGIYFIIGNIPRHFEVLSFISKTTRDKPSVYGPSTCTRPVCLECLRTVAKGTTSNGAAFRCPGCRIVLSQIKFLEGCHSIHFDKANRFISLN